MPYFTKIIVFCTFFSVLSTFFAAHKYSTATSRQGKKKNETFQWMPTWMNADVVSWMHCGYEWVLSRKHPTQQMWKHVKSPSFTFKLYVKVNLCAWVRSHSRPSSAWNVNVNSVLYNDKPSAGTIHFEA